MARQLDGKIEVAVKMKTETPVSVGGLSAGDAVDLEVAVNGKGEYYIPGTSLMGPLRARLEQVIGDKDKTNCLFGYQKDDNGHASHLTIEDAVLEGKVSREIRDGVGICRHTGAAEDKKKYTRAVLPRGAEFTLRMSLDVPKGDTKNLNLKGLLRCMLDGIKKDGLLLGAGKTRGLGKIKAESVCAAWYDFPEKLDDWLNAEGDPTVDYETTLNFASETSATLELLEIKVEWAPALPVMVKSGADGGIADMLPLVSGMEGGTLAPVIPGSSVKGVLRARAEKILRTVGHFVDTPDALQNDLFGSTEAAGRLSVRDTYQMANSVDAEKWAAEDKTVMDAATDHQDHVAIDRFTGGASDTALYNVRTPKRDKAWEPFTITVDFSRKVVLPATNGEKPKPRDISDEEKLQEVALLLLVLRDMQAGWVPIGFGSTRGLGDITVKDIFITGAVAGVKFDNTTLGNAMTEQKLGEAWGKIVPAPTKNDSQNQEAQHA